MAHQVNERSAAQLTIDFLDFDDATEAPTSGTYTVYDLDTGTVLSGPTALPVGASVSITLDKTDNQIVDDSKSVEAHYVLVKASYGGDDEVNAIFDYEVLNLAGLSGVA